MTHYLSDGQLDDNKGPLAVVVFLPSDVIKDDILLKSIIGQRNLSVLMRGSKRCADGTLLIFEDLVPLRHAVQDILR